MIKRSFIDIATAQLITVYCFGEKRLFEVCSTGHEVSINAASKASETYKVLLIVTQVLLLLRNLLAMSVVGSVQVEQLTFVPILLH